MKAVVYEKYGSPDGLQLTELQKPAPAEDQILIKIRAVSINGSDRKD
jgi:NADPH:quinone reductase-like Zn-dependent oxidoreductase